MLLELYSERREESNGYVSIKSLIECAEKGLHFDIKCFALDNDWKNDETYLMIVSDEIYNFIRLFITFFNTFR